MKRNYASGSWKRKKRKVKEDKKKQDSGALLKYCDASSATGQDELPFKSSATHMSPQISDIKDKDLFASTSTQHEHSDLPRSCREFHRGQLVRDQSPVIAQYKKFIKHKCQFLTEYNLPSDKHIKLADRCIEPVIIQSNKERSRIYFYKHVTTGYLCPSSLQNYTIPIDKLFDYNDKDDNIQKTVILSGDSGSGKSFMLQKIILDWASERLFSYCFDIVFLLKCEELKCVSEKMSLIELLSWSCDLTTDQISQMLQCSPQSLLFLIDGLDEHMFYPHLEDKSQPAHLSQRAPPVRILSSLLTGHMLPMSCLLVTTRTTATDKLKNLLKGPQRFIELMGFSEKGVEEYFQKYFQDEQLFGKAYRCVKANETLQIICSVPLMCWMVCFCLKYLPKSEDVMGELKTSTSVYVHFVSKLLEHHSQKQFNPTLLIRLGQLATKVTLKQEVLFDERTMFEKGVDVGNTLFLHEEYLNREGLQKMFKFMHLSLQEFFSALYYALLDEREMKHHLFFQRDGLLYPAMLFLCGLLNNEVVGSLRLFQPTWTVPQSIRENLKNTILYFLKRNLNLKRIFALHCLYELHDEEFVREVLEGYRSINFISTSLRRTDCWVLLYCLQCCPHITELNLTNCDLTADKLKILQPALCMRESLRFTVDHLSEVGDLIEALGESNILRDLNIIEESDNHHNLILTPRVSVCNGDIRLDLMYNRRCASLSRVCLTCPHSALRNSDLTIILKRFHILSQYQSNSPECNEHANALFSVLHSLCGLKRLELIIRCLNESWAIRILSLIQTCSSLQEISISISVLVLDEGLALLQESLTDPHCTMIIEGKKCNKPTKQCTQEDWYLTWSHICNENVKIYFKPKVLEELEVLKSSDPERSDLSVPLLPDCQCCAHIVDCDEWVQVEPSVCSDEGESKFRISTQPGHYECTRTRMRWVCDCDVTLQYHTVDGRSLIEELERLQCERIGPVFDVMVTSGKLKEVHLPHFICLAESDPSLKDAVKVLSQKDEGVVLQSVELTRFHAKIVQPSFSITTLIINWLMKREEHCNLLVYMRCRDPLILHVYFFPLNDACSKEKVEESERSSLQISHPRPNRPFRMNTPHLLDVPGASVHPMEGISFRRDIDPNFFKIKQDRNGDVQMTLTREEDCSSVWKAVIYKNELDQINPRQIQNEHCETGTDDFVHNNWSALIQRVRNVKGIADKLLEQKIIKKGQYLEIIDMNLTSEDSMRNICTIVQSGGRIVIDQFKLILQEEEPYLYRELMGD